MQFYVLMSEERKRKVCEGGGGGKWGGGGGMILSSLFTILVDEPLELPLQTICSTSKYPLMKMC